MRELAHYGAEHVKMTTTGRFYLKPYGELVNIALPTAEEISAAVDEAHKLGMWVATHTYGGDGLKWALQAGVDNIQHGLAADDADIRMFVQKNLPLTPTILDLRQDEPGDLKLYGQYSRFRLGGGNFQEDAGSGCDDGLGQRSRASTGPRLQPRVQLLARRAGGSVPDLREVGRYAAERAAHGHDGERENHPHGR